MATIDGKTAPHKNQTILEAARELEIYIPAICSHPYLPLSKKYTMQTHLCFVELDGKIVHACETQLPENSVVITNSEAVKTKRKESLKKILSTHPHSCLTCTQAEGCSRTSCSANVPVLERCCDKFGNCELEKISHYIGIPIDTLKYVRENLPVFEEAFFKFDQNLCIGCLRCVRVCKDVRDVGALTSSAKNSLVPSTEARIISHPLSNTLKESDCKFCGACIEVCPTGAILDKEKEIVPCTAKCPAQIDIPTYIKLISEGKFSEAVAKIREKVPFPSSLGYVCFHPCEDVCRRASVNEPIAICALKRFASQYDDGSWKKLVKPLPSTDKKVAVIGAGPGGLTSAYYLRKLGHAVTVYEASSKAGGMLETGILSYRLPKDILAKEINDIIEIGIELKLNKKINSLDEISGFDAIVVSTGLPLSKRLPHSVAATFRSPENIIYGIPFLAQVNSGNQYDFTNKSVVVIGGGNVAIDCARSALRLNAKEVKLFCLEQRNEMPAHSWEIETAIEEGIKINPGWGPKRISKQEHVAADFSPPLLLEFIHCTSVFDKNGKFAPSFNETKTTSTNADIVIIAIGQNSDFPFSKNDNVFLCGDFKSGPASVIDAIADGRKTAVLADRFLGGSSIIDEKYISVNPSPSLKKEASFAKKERAKMRMANLNERIKNFSCVELGLDKESAANESKRCLACNLRLTIPKAPLPPEPYVAFGITHINKMPENEGVFQLLDSKKNVIYIAGTMTLRKELEKCFNDNSFKEAKFIIYEENKLYTIRESELIQHHLKKHGKLPTKNEMSDDLF